MTNDKPTAMRIAKVVSENKRVKSFYFNYPFSGNPGQFVMLWIPGYDEIPVGIIRPDEKYFIVSVAAVGEGTNALHRLKPGDRVGIRGPYGSFFSLPKNKAEVALIAGGYGMVPLAFLAVELRRKNITTDLFIGARNKSELLFYGWMKSIGVNVYAATDDGSEGFHGFVTDCFSSSLKKKLYEMAYIVGPEIMEKKIAEICYKNRIPFEISLERYIKCGIGICGQCCVDKSGWRMCVEGPVVNHVSLKKIIEFGKYKRDAAGNMA